MKSKKIAKIFCLNLVIYYLKTAFRRLNRHLHLLLALKNAIFTSGIILQGRRGHIDFYVRVIRIILSPECSHSGHKINIVTRGLILPLSLEHKSQYALVGPAVLYQYMQTKNDSKYLLMKNIYTVYCFLVS